MPSVLLFLGLHEDLSMIKDPDVSRLLISLPPYHLI